MQRLLRVVALVAMLATGPLVAAQDATLTAGEVSGRPGDDVTLPITLDASDIVPTGASFGVVHDPEVLTLESIVMGADLAAYDDGEGPGFFVANLEPAGGDGGYVAFIALDSDGQITPFPAVEELAIVDFGYSIADDADEDSSSAVRFSEELAADEDAPNVAVVVVHGIERANLTLEDGEVDVVDGTVNILGAPADAPFQRGDANGDGSVRGLSDALFLLRYGFQEGAAPGCMDAADADDGGTVSGLSDGLFLLRWGFEEGAPPPEPGTASCGDDNTDDELGCKMQSDACAS